MKSSAKRLLLVLAAVFTVGFGLISSPSPASAQSSCGRYWPLEGYVNTKAKVYNYSIKVDFKFTPAELRAMQCAGEYLEIDYTLYGLAVAPQWSNYNVSSNLPGAQKDVAFEDITPVPAVTVIPTKQLQANTWYYATISWSAISAGAPQLGLSFVPSHWSAKSSPKEVTSCQVGKATRNNAWCVFPTTRHFVISKTVPVNGTTYHFDVTSRDAPNLHTA